MITLFAALALVQGPGPLHYRVEAKSVADVDLSAMGQGTQTQTMTTVALMSVTMSDSANGRIAHAVIDSVTFDGGAAIPPEMIGNAKGTAFHLFIVNGKSTKPAVPSEMSLPATQVAAALGIMFPGVKADAKSGDVWSDSSTAEPAAGSSGTPVHSSVQWTVGSVDNGTASLTGISHGTGTVGGGAMQMELQTTGKATVVSAPGGPAKSGNAVSTGEASMNMGGSAVPIRVTTSTTITQLP